MAPDYTQAAAKEKSELTATRRGLAAPAMTKKTAIVTGAANGIGRAVALSLDADGWDVAALDVDEAGLARLPEGIRRVTCDVADEGAVQAAFAALAFDRLDLLVNNAGIAHPVTGPIEALSLSEWRRITDSHLTGTFLVTRSAVPFLRKARGAIVNMASTRAFMSEPDGEAYAAAKGGIVAMTHALAVSLGPEVRANAIAPGWIVTGDPAGLSAADHAQHPVGRAGRVEDIVDAVRYLAGAGFVTGQVLTVDGGMTRKMIYVE